MSSGNKKVRLSIEAEKQKQQGFFNLAKRFCNATVLSEIKHLGDKLGRMVFGG
jgi:hypothetical protein